MGKKPGVMLYFEVRPALRRLSDEEKGRLFEAILDYGENGILPAFENCLGVVWDFIQPRIDADSQRYQKTAASRRNSAYVRWYKEKVQNDANADFAMQPMPPTSTASSSASITTSFCAEPEAVPTPPVITLPLNDGTEYEVTEGQCREWSELYPAVDVIQQLRQMRGWLLSNKERRKTKRGVSRFITNWLSREQDRGRIDHSGGERREAHGTVSSAGANPGQPAKKWGVPVVEL